MMLAELRALLRLTLASVTAWPDAKLDGWIAQAIQLYSVHFPRRWRHTLDLITGQQAYDLPCEHDLVKVLGVEYPLGRIPPEFLTLAPTWSPLFRRRWRRVCAAGLPDSDSALPGGSDSGVGQIVFAPTVSTGEQAVIEYLGAHQSRRSVRMPRSSPCRAPTCRPSWRSSSSRAHHELEADEAVIVESSSVVLAHWARKAARRGTGTRKCLAG